LLFFALKTTAVLRPSPNCSYVGNVGNVLSML
jgi:hypothetical protein